MSKKVVLIAPSPYSLYSTSMVVLLERKGVEVAGIIIKKFTLGRFLSEYKRDGNRLFQKIWKKLVLKDKAYAETSGYNIVQYRKDKDIKLTSLKELKDKKIIECTDLNSVEIEQFLKEINPDAVIFTGGGMIRKTIIELSGNGILNCHMAILPEYKGMDVVEWPVLNNEFDKVGVTVHLIHEGVDTGPILGMQRIDINNMPNFKQLRREFEPIMCDVLSDTAYKYLNGEIAPKEQDKTVGKQYFVMHDRLIGKAQKILNRNYAEHTKP